jgi:hypothetical protein
MNERRKLERYDLSVPAKIEVVGDGQVRQTLNLMTKNICAGGAFFNSTKSLPQNTKVAVELVLDFRGLQNQMSRWTRIKVSGFVLRSEPTGMTISFDKGFKIQPLSEAQVLPAFNLQ